MAKKIKPQDKVDIFRVVFLPVIKEKINETEARLQQAQDDYLNLYSEDGDKSKVIRNPIFSVVDGQVSVEILGKLIADVERMFNE